MKGWTGQYAFDPRRQNETAPSSGLGPSVIDDRIEVRTRLIGKKKRKLFSSDLVETVCMSAV